MKEKDSTAAERREPRGFWRSLAAVVTIIITVGVVGGLVYHRLRSASVGMQSVGSATVGDVSLNCRLPVVAGADVAFISFPSGAITIDHGVGFEAFKGGFGYTYDTQVRKWVPVPRSALSPDGRSYAYLAETSGVPGEVMSMSLHTHEIASGKDRVLWESSGSPMGPTLAWLPDGIYFSASMESSTGKGSISFPAVYLSDPNRVGAPRRVGPNPPPQLPTPGQPDYAGPEVFTFFGDGAAWATGNQAPAQAPSPNEPPAPGSYGPDRILRMDLRDGSVSPWYQVSGPDGVTLMGLDAHGHPVLGLMRPPVQGDPESSMYGPPMARLFLLTGPNQTVEITAASPDFHLGSMPSADAHGIWFGSWNSVWLYTQEGGLHLVATVQAGVFPSPSLPPGVVQGKGGAPYSPPPGMPSYMQGTLLVPAGLCS